MIGVFDIGGTTTRIAVSRGGRTFGTPRILDTPARYRAGVDRIVQELRELSRGTLTAVVGGIAGPVDIKNRTLAPAPNLRNWSRKPLQRDLSRALRVPVCLENDAALGGLGEAIYGAGKGYAIMAYITVGTGMNGARIVDGTVDANAHGFEIGRQIIDIGATFPFRRSARSLESLVSGAAMERRYKRPPYHITSACVWDAAARLLAYGVHNTVAYWSPDIVVIGGSMMKTPGISLTNVRRHLKKMPYALPEYPPIRNGKLGDVCGLYGALALARNGQR